ncbi:hypothetical protein KKF84_09350 [Myxococcota bacterium]|nr:hypothetical protein [Myxococcota bacterium]MBU1535515.1 hypothetical protein [Myxococcota bacterium]
MKMFAVVLLCIGLCFSLGCKTKKKAKAPSPEAPQTADPAEKPMRGLIMPMQYKKNINDAINDGNKIRDDKLKNLGIQ